AVLLRQYPFCAGTGECLEFLQGLQVDSFIGLWRWVEFQLVEDHSVVGVRAEPTGHPTHNRLTICRRGFAQTFIAGQEAGVLIFFGHFRSAATEQNAGQPNADQNRSGNVHSSFSNSFSRYSWSTSA